MKVYLVVDVVTNEVDLIFSDKEKAEKYAMSLRPTYNMSVEEAEVDANFN